MKRFALIIVCLLALLPAGRVWAGSSATLNASISSVGKGSGRVYLSESGTATDGKTELTKRVGIFEAATLTAYAFAVADADSVFRGWTTENGSTSNVRRANPLECSQKSGVFQSTTATVYAIFDKKDSVPQDVAEVDDSQDGMLVLKPETSESDGDTAPVRCLAKANGEGQYVEVPNSDLLTIELTDFGGNDPTGLYKVMTKVGAGNGQVTMLSTTTIGVLKCNPSLATSIVPVPWLKEDGDFYTPDDLFRSCDLADGDMLRVFDSTGKTYNLWTRTEGAWHWVKTAKIKESGETVVSQEMPASGLGLLRGAAVWLTRAGNDRKPFYIWGWHHESVPATTVTAGTEEKPAWTLVANPNLTPFNVSAILKGANVNTADTIIVPSTIGEGQRTYTYKNGAWGYTTYTTVTIRGQTAVKATRVTDESTMTVGPGQGFWYVSRGGAPTIQWR